MVKYDVHIITSSKQVQVDYKCRHNQSKEENKQVLVCAAVACPFSGGIHSVRGRLRLRLTVRVRVRELGVRG